MNERNLCSIDRSCDTDHDRSEEENVGDDKPGFEISLIAGAVVIATIMIDKRKKNRFAEITSRVN